MGPEALPSNFQMDRSTRQCLNLSGRAVTSISLVTQEGILQQSQEAIHMNTSGGTKHTVPVVFLLLIFTLMCSLNAAAQWLGANNIADATTNASDKSNNAQITAATTDATGTSATYTGSNAFTAGQVVSIPAGHSACPVDASLCGTKTVASATATTFTVNGTFPANLSGAFAITAVPISFDPISFLPGESYSGDTSCMQCHSQSPNMPALYPNPLTRLTGVTHDPCSANLHDCGPLDTNGYLMTGHKNILRKVLPTQAQDGAPMAQTGSDGLTYTGDPLFNWVNGTYNGNSLLYVLGWLPSEEAPYVSYLKGGPTAATGNGINLHGANMAYSCARCHTTGYSFDATGPEPTLSNADGTYTRLTDAQFPRTPTGWASGTATASWYLTGIQCERCHGTSHTDCSAVGVAYPKIGGQTVTDCNAWQDPSGAWHVAKSHAVANVAATALCIECHRQERSTTTGFTGSQPVSAHTVQPAQLPGQNLPGWPAIPGVGSLGAASDSGKCSDGSSTPYSKCVAAGLKWNFQPSMSHGANGAQTFLNSPHARFTGTLQQNAQNSPDLSVQLNGTFASYFTNWGEGLGTANSNNGGCPGCHNPHYSTVATATPAPTPIVKWCQDCHTYEAPGRDFSIKVVNHPVGAETPLPNGLSSTDSSPCVVCHMAAAGGAATYHYFRINEDLNYYTFGPASAWYASSDTPGNGQPNTYTAEGHANYPAVGLDVDIACGQCHVGGDGTRNTYGIANSAPNAAIMTRAALATYAKNIHAPFVVSAPSSATGKQGQPLAIDITLSPRLNGFFAPVTQSPVTLSVSGLPANATYSLSANPVLPVQGGAISTLTITLPSTTAQLGPQRHSRPFLALFLPFFGIALGSVVLGGNKQKRAIWLLGLVLLISLAAAGCGGATPYAPVNPNPQSFTVRIDAISGSTTVSTPILVIMN
jgi:predicted CXXCH cytochrome family protein